ncbi:MAG: benzoate-CoA ligase [Rhodospirillales bacterium]|nr:benzoate-CoA ligase [Rhodospirillales bacterium]
MPVQPSTLPDGCYNAALDLLDRNLAEGRGERIAVIDDAGAYSYAALTERANRFANALEGLGMHREQRLLMVMQDTVDFPTVFLGAIKAGIVPVPVNTALTVRDFDGLLGDSAARVVVVSEPLLATLAPVLEKHRGTLAHVIVAGSDAHGLHRLNDLLERAAPTHAVAPTVADDICFWLYSSGSTGTPKGAVHLHSHLMQTARLYAQPILGITESDVVFSAAKLFFAYGLGNAMTFPFSVGATAVLMAERPTPAAVARRLVERQATIFYGVPTLYGAMLASSEMPPRDKLALRIATSAGEALPADFGERWKRATGCDILDGIGSTEMLHIFISNRPDALRYGTSGQPVPGYEARVVGDNDEPVGVDAIGDLQVSGPTACIMYWRKREQSRQTFLGPWLRTGDKYRVSEDGYWTYCGRSDDMLKVSGQYVSPFEVEGALLTHESVLEAAVVGHDGGDGLIKPKAFVVLKDGTPARPDLSDTLKAHVKAQLAPFKYPRWIEFLPELPKTATGKIQRFKLRQ